jgi:hypothetical protein
VEFVPPRDKTPCFWGFLRPATGHLSNYAICTGNQSSASDRPRSARDPPDTHGGGSIRSTPARPSRFGLTEPDNHQLNHQTAPPERRQPLQGITP